MVKCDDEHCVPLCDFCINFKRLREPWGHCNEYDHLVLLWDVCNDFHCYKAKES